MKAIKVDLYFSILLMAIGGLIYVEAKSYPETPGEFPLWIGLILIGLSALLFIQSLLKRSDETQFKLDKRTLTHIFISAAIIAAYVLILPLLGYIVSSLILVLSMSLLLGYRSLKYLALTPLAAVMLCWVVFQFILNVPLPAFGF